MVPSGRRPKFSVKIPYVTSNAELVALAPKPSAKPAAQIKTGFRTARSANAKMATSRVPQSPTNANLATQAATNAPALASPNAPTVVMKSQNLAGG
jgi:hypothetical protein